MKKYDEDLNTTLIFVSRAAWCAGVRVLTQPQAGLFSAVTSAFILNVQSQLQPDTGEETAALLRVLIYKIDNTTFGNDPPTLPQWTGPPHMIVQVQAILYASLSASLLAAFLAMLGKQWLNRYASTDMRGSAIERSQNRQRKLDGIAVWYFDPVMESLPLMLQIALLLLGCALSRYLWAIDIAVASVVLGVTSSGIIFYIFIVTAGAISESCPYQTPGSHTLRYTGPKVWSALYSATSAVVSAVRRTSRKSQTVRCIKENVWDGPPRSSGGNVGQFFVDMVLGIPLALVVDIYNLVGAMIWELVAFLAGVYYLGSKIVRSLFGFIHSTPFTPERGPNQQTAVLDLSCISWMIQTSLDKADHLSTLKHLATMEALADFNPTLVADCLSIFIGCINLDDHNVTTTRGLEQLATSAATCFLRTFCHLSATDPTSSILTNVRQRYRRVFPPDVNFAGHSFRRTVFWIHTLLNRPGNVQQDPWDDYKPSTQDYTAVAQGMAGAAQTEYRGSWKKVPRWILRFALYSLSLNPPPPKPAIAYCLLIIAIELDCDVSVARFTKPNERYVHVLQMVITLTSNQCTSGASFEPDKTENQSDGRSRRL